LAAELEWLWPARRSQRRPAASGKLTVIAAGLVRPVIEKILTRFGLDPHRRSGGRDPAGIVAAARQAATGSPQGPHPPRLAAHLWALTTFQGIGRNFARRQAEAGRVQRAAQDFRPP